MIGIYKITHTASGKFYIGSSKNIRRRFADHRNHMNNRGKFDCGWIPEDKDLSHYEFEVVEECSMDDLVRKEIEYIKNADHSLCVNDKIENAKSAKAPNPMSGKKWCTNGVEDILIGADEAIPEGFNYGRTKGVSQLKDYPKNNATVGYNKPYSHYVDTSKLDIQILSKNEFVPMLGILVNNKAASNPLCEVRYLYRGKITHAVTVTTDHPLYTQRGRVRVEDLVVGDKLYDSETLEEYPITEIIPIKEKSETYDVETDNDIFDLSGILSHNCRTRVMADVNSNRPQAWRRGNLSFTTINLPRLALLNKGNWEGFYADLDKYMELVKDQLLERYQLQCKQRVKNFKFLMGQHVWLDSEKLSRNDTLESVLKHGSLSIGFIGLAETLKVMTGFHHGESEEAQKKGLEIVKYMRDYCDKMTEQYKLNFTLLATPAEGLSGRFTKLDRAKFGDIPGITDKGFYTNSCHVPVEYPCSAFHKIQVEAPYHALCNAGHILYVHMDGDATKNLEAYEKIVRCMHDNNVGYGAVNIDVDYCRNCHKTGIFNEDKCPFCGSPEIDRIRRITGYLVGSLEGWNPGKKAEYTWRLKGHNT